MTKHRYISDAEKDDQAGLAFRPLLKELPSHLVTHQQRGVLTGPLNAVLSFLEFTMRHALDSGSRASAPDIKTLLRPLADLVRADLLARGRDIRQSQVLELLAAAFGFHSYKVMLSKGPRIVKASGVSGSAEFSQYRPGAIEARAKSMLEMDHWAAIGTASLVIERLRASGLLVDSLEAHLRGDADGQAILSALASGHHEYNVINATVAVRAGLLAAPDMAGGLVVPYPNERGRIGQWSDILEALERSDVRIWWWPDSNAGKELVYPTLDVYRPMPLTYPRDSKFGGSAELGLGFTFVAQEPFELRGQPHGFSVSMWTPWMDCRSDGVWRTNWHRTGFIGDPTHRDPYRRRTLPVDVSTLPRAKMCQQCRQIHVAGGSGFLAHQAHGTA